MAEAAPAEEAAVPAEAAPAEAVAAETAAQTPVDTDGAADQPADGAISDEEVSALLETGTTDGVQPFDFSSRRISRTRLPMLEFACKGFAERASVSLAALLSRDVGMQFETLLSAKTIDLQAALPLPASMAVVRLKPLPGSAFISVDPALLVALLDGFFGGSGRVTADPQAALAPAAQRFLSLLVRGFAADWTAAWAPVAPVEFELLKLESNPRFLQLGEPQDLMIAAKFTVEFGTHTGRITWLLPDSLLAPLRETLASEGGKPTARVQPAWAPVLSAALQGAELETRAILAEAEISLGDLVRLLPGDIIPIEAPQEATLLAGDVPLYRGRFGISQGRNALKILPGGLV